MSDYNGKSKDELISIIKSMEGTAGMEGGAQGWMVTAANPDYNGKTAGVQFNGGKAFLSPAQYSPEQIEVLVRTLKNDFGYNVVEATIDQYYGRSSDVSTQLRAQLTPAAAPAPATEPAPAGK